MTTKQALTWTILWFLASLLVAATVYLDSGLGRAATFLTVYGVEWALSMDNLFVFLLIFQHFDVPRQRQRVILNYGLIGALAFRAVFIFGGVELLHHFHWMLDVMAIALVYMGCKLALLKEEDSADVSESLAVRLARRFGVRSVTVMVILAIEVSDIIFAIDSVPASFGITRDAAVIYTANICAILGLRSMFFLLQNVADRMKYLNLVLGVVLVLIGVNVLVGRGI